VASPLAQISYAGEPPTGLLRVVTTETDRRLRKTFEGWARLSPEDFATVREALSTDDFYKVVGFAQRAVVFTIRDADPGWALSAAWGLAAVVHARVDTRDLILAVELTAYALKRTGADVLRVLEPAITRSEPETRAILEQYAREPPASIDWCGFALVDAADGLALVSSGSNHYQPTVDLAAMAIELVEVIDADRYRVSSFTVASNLPEVWFRGSRHTDAMKAIKNMRGCVSLQAGLSSIQDPRQLLLVFIAQLKSAAEAEMLAIAAREGTLGDPVLSATARTVFGVIIGRSFVSGAKDLESPESLARFTAALTSALGKQVKPPDL